MLSPLKYTGSKRTQAPLILNKLPKFDGIYYEPFVGGASVLLEFLVRNNGYHCIASDINPTVIKSWNLIKSNPEKLFSEYCECWNRVERNEAAYYDIRKEFNENKEDVSKFVFMVRCAINGLVRFSKNGNFNSPKNPARKNAMKPSNYEKYLYEASWLVRNTEFLVCSYNEIKPSENDFCYFDPPYTHSTGMYYGNIDLDAFWKYINNLKCKWILSFDGKINGVPLTDIPLQYKNVWYTGKKQSKFKEIARNKGTRIVEEAMYSNF